MNPLLSINISYRAIRSNKVRSFLTTLGIIIGVAAVISLVSITGGAKKMIEGQLASLGANSLAVKSGKITKSGKTLLGGNVKPLTGKDVEAIRNLESVKYVSAISNTTANVVSGNRNVFTAVIGTGKDFIFINDWFPERGTFFNEIDVREAALVCVLGKTVKENLFGSQDPIGKNLRIGKYTYRVIGVMSPIGPTPSGKDQDDIVLLPYTSVQKRLVGTRSLDRITIFVDPAYDLTLAQRQVEKVLRRQHGIKDEMEDDFSVRTQQTQINTIKNVSRILTVLLGSIASISLVVGGIGIMNIMLVSVGERTREIGIRLAVGAKEKNILVQFLIESVLLSLVGGAIGTAAGILISKLASAITGWPTQVSVLSIIVAFLFSALVGIVFGIYPAKKAAALNPIEALRYE
ncbi:MAG: FtsX-like permease family protein [Candidatus Dadabacteria bacterium]|nr:FtsX-like permease family protein [Candidatus Dadabacteria bacterium]MYA48541.1 FtsX-like permease family protein [Candidatus Dadabacteria bacterium]MYG83377.1 FtsX-like permease family protein [Candidatus Dadabacteria bacterium]MYK49529.1 FtsX-like permease family protein [Candidatus Dadabacteria bacterium]